MPDDATPAAGPACPACWKRAEDRAEQHRGDDQDGDPAEPARVVRAAQQAEQHDDHRLQRRC